MTELLIDAGYSNWLQCCQISRDRRPGPLLLLCNSWFPSACPSASCPSAPSHSQSSCSVTDDPDASLGALEERGEGNVEDEDVDGSSC